MESVAEVQVGDARVKLTRDMVSFLPMRKKIEIERFVPSVIEPAFGVGRLIAALLEHSFYQRPENDRRVFRFKPSIAPVKVAVLSVESGDVYVPIIHTICTALRTSGVAHQAFLSASIGVGDKYKRADEIGTPLAITIDPTTLKDSAVTIRERDTMAQIRVPLEDAVSVCQSFCCGAISWDQLVAQYARRRASYRVSVALAMCVVATLATLWRSRSLRPR